MKMQFDKDKILTLMDDPSQAILSLILKLTEISA